MHANDEIDALFETAGKESEAIEALDGAVTMLKAAREAKAQLVGLDAPRLRDALQRRSGSPGDDAA